MEFRDRAPPNSTGEFGSRSIRGCRGGSAGRNLAGTLDVGVVVGRLEEGIGVLDVAWAIRTAGNEGNGNTSARVIA
jgi:hypothetical protein